MKATLESVVPGLTEGLRAQLDVYPDNEVVEEVEKYDVLHSESQVHQWAQTVDAIAAVLTPQYLSGGFGGCLRDATITDACWKSFFVSFGRRVYRRPLSTTEVSNLAALVQRRSAASDAMYAAIHLLFRSPAFLFHLELGTTEESGRVRLSDHEVANRIAFGVLGTPPDAELAAAADAGQVRTLTQVEAQVKRLMESNGAKTKMQKFVSEWLQLSHIQPPQNEYMVFLKALGGNGDVDRAFKQEIQDYMYYMIFKKRGNFTDLMTAPIAFPRYQGLFYSDGSKPFSALAGIYGDDKYANFTPEGQAEAIPFAAPNNPGLLTRAGFMSSAHYETQPITRGVFIQRRILCEPLPSPDFSVVAQRLGEVGTLDPLMMANHQIVTAKTSATACASCHAKINPVGFALEGLDMIGKLRPKQEVIDITKFYSEKKGVVATFDLPTPVSNVLIGEKTATVSSPADLAQQVAGSSRAKLCMSTFVLRHFDRRRENGGDSCSLSEATQALQSGRPILDVFVKMMANEDIFWRRK